MLLNEPGFESEFFSRQSETAQLEPRELHVGLSVITKRPIDFFPAGGEPLLFSMPRH